MGVMMLFEVVDFGLLVVAQIANAELRRDVSPREGNVERERMAQGGCCTDSGRHDIMVVVAPRENLIVGLSIVGGEHQADQGGGQFVVKG